MGLECRGLTVCHRGRTLVDAVDLDVPTGSTCVVMGPSGAGKSTLLRAVAGLTGHGGAVAVDGRDLVGVAPHRRRIGLLFQNPRLFPNMTVVDNVAYALRLRGMRRNRRRSQAQALLDEVGLGDRTETAPQALSGGEQQRVALARALCSDPDVLLLDEPLTGLDLPQRRELVRLLARMQRDRQVTWLVVTHDPDDAAVLADTIAVLDDGRLVQHDSVDSVYSRPLDELVCALTGNPNVLRGRVHDGLACLGNGRGPAVGADGPAVFTIAPHRVHLGDRSTEHPHSATTMTLAMTVVDVERRGPGSVVRLEGEAGTLEVPCTGSARPGRAVDVRFDPADLWRIPGTPLPPLSYPSKELSR